MQKFIKSLCLCLMMFSAVIFAIAFYAGFAIPDEITAFEERQFRSSGVFHFSTSDKTEAAETVATENYELNVSLLKIIPLRKTKVHVGNRRYVSLGGEVFGLKIYSKGVLVISTEDILTENGLINPGKKAGIKSGDIIREIDGKEINSNKEISQLCKKSNGKELEFTILRKSEEITLSLTTAKEKSSGIFKAGLWVRDSTAGIGTMTFYDRETGVFASLGHAVCDGDTGIVLPLSEGTAVSAKILGCSRGTETEAGELSGAFEADTIGKLYKNNECGVYGKLDFTDKDAEILPVATAPEVKTGKAQILCTVDERGKRYYDVEITKILDTHSEEKNMTVKITDEELLGITGGIVQGMSGTPLIQNGMLVGAITHVFVGTPTEGYAVFAENMLSVADTLTAASEREAS